MTVALRIVVVAPDLAMTDPDDDHALEQAERSRVFCASACWKTASTSLPPCPPTPFG
jgi:hypothetical protein